MSPARHCDAAPADDLTADWRAAAADRALHVRWPERILELEALIVAALRAVPPGTDPHGQAMEIIAALSRAYQGEHFRLSHPVKVRALLREARIWREFDGRNVHALARRYHLHTGSVWRILNRQRTLYQQVLQRQRGRDA